MEFHQCVVCGNEREVAEMVRVEWSDSHHYACLVCTPYLDERETNPSLAPDERDAQERAP